MVKDSNRYQSVQGINDLNDLANNRELIGDFFRTVKIKISISPINDGASINNSFDNDHAQQYTITDLSIEKDTMDQSNSLYQEVVNIVNMLSERIRAVDINQKIKELIDKNTSYRELKQDLESLLKNNESSMYNSEWSVFYLLKELFQCIKGKPERTVYYRGQSHDWEVVPGVIRPGVNQSYARDFEEVYHNLAFEFEDIDYIGLDKNMTLENQEKRAQNIALLQHFNLLTPYVDITSNEFIAMFFMIDSGQINKPSIDIIFQNNDKDDNKQSLVQKAPTSHQNIRLSAQKGSFLNFEKTLVNDSITKVDRIRVVIDYDVNSHIKTMNQERTDLGKKSHRFGDLLKSMSADGNIDETQLEDLLENKVKEIDTKLRELIRLENDSPEQDKSIQNQLSAALSENFKYSRELSILKANRNKLFSNLKDEIERKLEEFRYTSAEIYPDLPNRLSSIKIKYSKQTNQKQIVRLD